MRAHPVFLDFHDTHMSKYTHLPILVPTVSTGRLYVIIPMSVHSFSLPSITSSVRPSINFHPPPCNHAHTMCTIVHVHNRAHSYLYNIRTDRCTWVDLSHCQNSLYITWHIHLFCGCSRCSHRFWVAGAAKASSSELAGEPKLRDLRITGGLWLVR